MTVANIFFENKQDNYWITLANNTIAPLWYMIREWLPVVCITSGVMYASIQFNIQHTIFPLIVAILISIGVTWTYLAGMAFATAVTTKSGWTHAMIILGSATEALFGMLYVAGKYKLIPDQPDMYMALSLVVAHIVPLIGLLMLYTYCKRLYMAELNTQQQIVNEYNTIERTRTQRIADDKEDYERRVREAKLALILRREEIKLTELDNSVKINATKTCDKCGQMLNRASYAAMKRYGYCSQCKK